MATGGEHKAWCKLMHQHPELSVDLLEKKIGPEHILAHKSIRLDSADLSDLSNEHRGDAVVVLEGVADKAVLGIVVEVQRGWDPDKWWVWPLYWVTLRHRLQALATVLVLCPKQKMVKWCSQVIELGPRCQVLAPVVVGPSDIPVITDASFVAAKPEWGTLSAVAHGTKDVYRALIDGLHKVLVDFDFCRTENCPATNGGFPCSCAAL